MTHRNWTLTGLSAVTVAALAIYETAPARAQQGVPAQGGQPSQQPRPANPEPAPSNPEPRSTTPPPQLAPVQPTTQPAAVNPRAAAGNRYERPFAFQSPQIESRFNESTHQLAGLEQRMGRSNHELLKRLGEVRAMPAEKQNSALIGLLQQMLLDQADMQKYLVQARTAWSGEIDAAPGGETTQPANAPTAEVPPQNPPR